MTICELPEIHEHTLEGIIAIANKYIFHGEIEKIIEVTYSYRCIDGNKNLNETLFEEYTGLLYPEYSLRELHDICKGKLEEQICFIEKIIHQANTVILKSENDAIRRKLFTESLEYIKKVLTIALLGLKFELEKAGIPTEYTEGKTLEIIKKIETLEAELFGPKIIENSEEFSACYNYILRQYQNKKYLLSKTDAEKMQKYLDLIKESRKCELIESKATQKKQLSGDFLHKKISREATMKIFDSVCELYGLPQRTKLTNAGSIYDGDEFLEIPNNAAHKEFTVERILRLIAHEIESHYINLHNGKILFGDFRGANNLPKEEGLAIFMERIFIGYKLDSDEIIEYSYFTLAGEVLTGEQLQDLIRISNIFNPSKRKYMSSYIRAKRNYSFENICVQHKDVAYSRGFSQIQKYLYQKNAFYTLFLGKTGFGDINKTISLYENSKQREKIIFPIFISDVIYFCLSNHKLNFQTHHFEKYLYEKYNFLNIKNWFTISRVEKKLKQIKQILQLIEDIIENTK